MKKWKCTVCGYIHDGEDAPEKCPVCSVASDKFEEVIEKQEDNKTSESESTSRKWRCKVCGYEHEGDQPPTECPLCGAGAEQFELIGGPPVEEPSESAQPQLKGPVKTWKCSVCGFVHEGDSPPEKCPLCGVEAEKFDEEGAEAEKKKDNKDSKPSFLVKQILKHHLHPIIVHTPNGVLPVALVFMVLSVLLSNQSLETAAFYNMIFVLASLPAVLATGVIVWKKRFGGAATALFKIKILASVVVTLLLAGLVGWRVIEPDVLTGPNKWIYVAVTLSMVAAVGLAGHLGGKLVFGGREE